MGVFVSLVRSAQLESGMDYGQDYPLETFSMNRGNKYSSSVSKFRKHNSNNMITRGSMIDGNCEGFQRPPMYHRPQDIDTLCQLTKFSKKEMKILYQGFKQQCPNGSLNFDTFKDIYGQFFPEGNPIQYAHYIFNTFDKNHSGCVAFEDFVKELSLICKGTMEEKLNWAFNLYDINGDGVISKEEMTKIVFSIYELLYNVIDAQEPKEIKRAHHDLEVVVKTHVDRIFKKMDINSDGFVSSEEFIKSCINEENIKNIAYLDTILKF